MMKSTSAISTSALRTTPGSARASAYFRTPQGWLFLLLAIVALATLGFGDRSIGVLDQDNYVAYFKVTTWDWVVRFYQDSASLSSFVISLVTEELGWRVWVVLVNSLGMMPEAGVRLTVIVMNLLVMYSLAGLRRPLIGLILWLVMPTALATVGLFQIRQGFAFALTMLFAVRLNRPILGALIASAVHTTFAVPALLLIAARLCRRRLWIALVGVSATALVLASSASFLFQNFGGRRLEEYAGYQDDFTIRLIALLVGYMIASVAVLYSSARTALTQRDESIRQMCIMHIGLVIYLVAAFLVFPFGKGRVWYCVPLLVPFLVPEIRFRNVIVVWLTVILLSVVTADIVKSYYEEVYTYFIG
jgi:hypothetical protein